MKGCIVGEPEKPFIPGSSKPKEEETLRSKLFSMITPQLVYKDGSKELEVSKIKELNIFEPTKGDYTVHTQERFNYAFRGSAMIEIKDSGGLKWESKTITGYFQSDDEKEIKTLFNEISV